MSGLCQVLSDGDLRLEPLADRHVEPLRAACARDTEIWDIYPISMLGEHFDKAMEEFHATTSWVRFAVLWRDQVIGMSSYINPDTRNHVVEIGGIGRDASWMRLSIFRMIAARSSPRALVKGKLVKSGAVAPGLWQERHAVNFDAMST